MLIVAVAAGVILLVALMYILALKPAKMRDAQKFADIYYAHRGLHSKDIPENSLEAISRACSGGFGIEFDVQLAKDGVVVFHDDDLSRMCGVPGNVADFTCEQLCALPLAKTEHKIHTLEQVLDEVAGRVPLIIELKNSKDISRLCQTTFDILKNYDGVYCVESFNPFIVRRFKKQAPHIPRGQLSSAREAGANIPWLTQVVLQNMLLNFVARPNFIAYNIDCTRVLAFKAARKLWGAYCVAWTVKDKRQLEDANFDLFIFEGFLPDKG